MDGVIVAVVHDEFRGMGLSGVRRFVDEGVVFDGCGLERWCLCGMFDVQGRGKGFLSLKTNLILVMQYANESDIQRCSFEAIAEAKFGGERRGFNRDQKTQDFKGNSQSRPKNR